MACSSVETPQIKVGLGETVITPTGREPMRGYRRPDISRGIHDDLHARSIVIEGGDGTTAVMLTLSIANLNHIFMDRIRETVSVKTGIPEDNIIISCTHTHSGPYVEQASESYQAFFVERSAASAIHAWENRVPARIGIGSGEALEVGMNDRRMEYGGLHPDPEVGIIKIEDMDGRLLGVACNYGCHPSTLDLHNMEFTEDFPYYTIRRIKEEVGENVWAAYFQSAQGDVKVGYTAELSAVGAEMPIRNFWYAEVKGSQLAEAVLENLAAIETTGDPVVNVSSSFFNYPLRQSCPKSVAEAEKCLSTAREHLSALETDPEILGKRVINDANVDIFLAELMLGWAEWVENNPDPEPLSIRHQAVRIGESVFATFPVEVFTEIGLKVKNNSPFAQTFIFGVAGGHNGYIPTVEEFHEGGYAVFASRFAPECEQVCIDASLAVINDVYK